MYFYRPKPASPGPALSWTLRYLLRTNRQYYIQNLKHLSQVESEEEDFLYIFMYFSGLKIRPMAQSHLGPWDLCLNKFGKEQ